MDHEEIVRVVGEATRGPEPHTMTLTYVDLKDDTSRREIEPYSYREKNTGNIVLYGWDTTKQEIRCFILERILNLEINEATFTPRWEVEVAMV